MSPTVALSGQLKMSLRQMESGFKPKAIIVVVSLGFPYMYLHTFYCTLHMLFRDGRAGGLGGWLYLPNFSEKN